MWSNAIDVPFSEQFSKEQHIFLSEKKQFRILNNILSL